MKSETEFKESYEREVEEKWRQARTDVTVIEKGELVGTLVGQVEIICGGKSTIVPVSAITKKWTAAQIAKTVDGHHYTNDLKSAVSGEIGECPAMIPAVYQPVVGKTCHHVKFKEPSNDSCHPDGTNCVELDGTSFVVCHHNAFKWIGGEKCNCSHIDGSNVMIVKAVDLDSTHYT